MRKASAVGFVVSRGLGHRPSLRVQPPSPHLGFSKFRAAAVSRQAVSLSPNEP